MSTYALPALLALLSKLWVYIFVRNSSVTSSEFLWLLCFFGINNLSEFLIITQLFDDALTDSLLRIYYVSAIFCLAYMCLFARALTGGSGRHNILNYALLSIATIISGLVYFTDAIIEGFVSIGYTVTRIQGDFYTIIPIVALCGFTLIVVTILRTYLTTVEMRVQLKCFYAGFSLLPLIIMTCFVLVMMQLGFGFTGAVLMPLVTTLFLLLIILTQKHTDIINIQHRLPFSYQRKKERELLHVYRSHIKGEIGLNETKDEFDKILIRGALEDNNNNVTWAAKKLGIQRSTLYSILNRLGMSRTKNTKV